MSTKLFTPLKIGNVELKQRIAMAPLTRLRADDNHVPLPFVKEYYEQRASVPGTLLIGEATVISPFAGGSASVPGIYSAEQITAWKEVTDAVHKKGSFIYMQLWALGRTADPETFKKETGKQTHAPSAIAYEGGATPVALTEEEILAYPAMYRQAALNAIEAGFDGVEIHGANGYLVDQFLQDVSNKRTDAWGGSIEKRAKFGLDAVKAVVDAIGGERTAIRLSPYSEFQGMKMDDPVPQFSYFAKALKPFKLAYLHVIEERVAGKENVEYTPTKGVNFLIDIWANQSPVLLAGGYKPETAYTATEEFSDKDIVVVFGRHFIANPDLVFRVKHKLELNPYDRHTFYLPREKKGYTEGYPFSKEFLAQTQNL